MSWGDAKRREEKTYVRYFIACQLFDKFSEMGSAIRQYIIDEVSTVEILPMCAKFSSNATCFNSILTISKAAWLITATSIGNKTNEPLRNNNAVVENFNVQFLNAKTNYISLHFVYSLYILHFHKNLLNPLRACQKMYFNVANV